MFTNMRFFKLIFLYLSASAISALPLSHAFALDQINITLYKAEVFEMPEGTSTLIVGNPVIADISVLKKGSKVLITGKGFGETNVLAMDSDGNIISETRIRVSASNENKLIVQKGTDRESYSCSPSCMPTVNLGDAPAFISQTTGQIQAHTAASTAR